jgi:hypothetical protein
LFNLGIPIRVSRSPSLVNQATMSYVLPIELSAERLGLAAMSAPD